MAKSTALEALTAELLGDVGLLHDRIKSLPIELDAYVQQAKEELEVTVREIELQTGATIAAAKQLDSRTEAMMKNVGEYIASRRNAEAEVATIEIRTAANAALADTVKRVADEANGYIAKSIGAQLSANIAKLKAAEGKLSRSTASFGWKWAILAGGATAGGIVSVLLVAWLSIWWQRDQVESLVDQRQTLMAEISQMQTKVAVLEKRGGKLATNTCGGRLCIEASTNQGEGQTAWIGPWKNDKGTPMVIPKGY
jgi:hypothetical protein